MISRGIECLLLALLVLISHGRQACAADAPISTDLFGKGFETGRYCDSGGTVMRGEFKLLNWGLSRVR